MANSLRVKEALEKVAVLSAAGCDDDPSPRKQIACLSEAGFLQTVLPGEELSFSKGDMPALLRLLKSVGRADLSVGRIYEGHVNALWLIHRFATPEQQQRWFADAAGGCLFGVWNTQAENGIRIATENETYVLEGKKTFASGAGLVRRALITGDINNPDTNGWQMCLVNMERLPPENIDTKSWQPLGMNSSISYTVDFSGYEGNKTDLFGKVNDYYRQPFFSAGAIRFCAVQLGGAEALFNHTLSYLKTLHRTNDPFQNARIAQMATVLSSGDMWLEAAGKNWKAWVDNEEMSDALIAFANMVRTATEKICWEVIELSFKCIGARGLQRPFVMEKIARDLQFYLRQPAPDAAVSDIGRYIVQSNKNIETIWHENI